jgi:aldehyde:ferredoxin oxidoreductase
MDLYEHGMITKEQTDGVDLRFGNAEALVQMVKKIGLREGWLGDVLAEGSMRAAEKIGKGAEEYACHIKGLELPGYDLRSLKTAALGFSVSFRGACHLRSRFTMEEMDLPPEATKKIIGRAITSDPDSYEGKAYPAIWTEKLCAIGDALGICRFVTKWLSPGLLGEGPN